MQIVIDIPEEDYKFIKDLQFYSSGRRSGRTIEQHIINGIRNGTPLPKGHGDLIDRNTITVEEDVYFQNYIIHAPTIIAADKENEDGNSN